VSGSLIGGIVIGVILTAVAFAHPIGPALMLAAETPYDGMMFVFFDVWGNAITYVPIVIFLVKVNPVYWGQAFLGTRLQQLIALFFMSLLLCHAVSLVDMPIIGQILEWLRKVTLFLLTGVFAFAMRERYLPLLVKVMVAAMALFTLLSMMDFYLGIQVLPVKTGVWEEGALGVEFEIYHSRDWRFTGGGFPVNRFSNYLLLVIFLGIGWFMYARNRFERLFAIGCATILILAELFTVTRSGILGMVVGLIVMLPLALRFRAKQVAGVVVVGAALATLTWYAVSLTSADEMLGERFDPEHVVDSTGGRLERYEAAFKIWAEHPFIGVGWGAFKQYSPEYIGSGGKGAHNGYLNVLAETGLLGFVPLMILLVTVVRRSLMPVGDVSSVFEFWRPYFFCGLLAQLVTNVFNDYLWERYLWVNVAFCVVLEQCRRAARVKDARARLQTSRGFGAPGSDPAPSPLRVS
jgi:O-antigen ligase